MKNRITTFLDFGSAITVLISLFHVATNRIFWIPYAVACFIYVFLNWKRQLYGQSIMNIVAGLIAIKNFIVI